MKRFGHIAVVLAVVMLIGTVSSEAIERVPGKLYVFDIYGGYAQPTGSYDGLADIDFRVNNQLVDVDASDLYDGTFFVGFNVGGVWRNHWQTAVGFRYTDHKVSDTIPLPFDTILVLRNDINFRQYDIDVNFNYMVNDLRQSFWTPYVGTGFHVGVSSISVEGFDSENDLAFAMSLNFGAEVKLFTSSSGKLFMTLASMNNWNFLGTNDRPKYLHIGGGIRYYMK